MAFQRLGIIGGTGLGAALGGVAQGTAHELDTPFGKPAGPIVTAELDGIPVALLSRHGPGHVFNPSHVPYRANIHALKQLGVTHVLASTAVGSLREEIHPGELVLPDQIIDRTYRRAGTFFDDLTVHVELAAPLCPTLRFALIQAAEGVDTTVHPKGTYVCMEGPQFSTRAESDLHRSWGAHLIGMTAMPEAKLAREAELCYALVSLPTDYDCWRPPPANLEHLDLIKEIIGNLNTGTERALALIRTAAPLVAEAGARPCLCQNALEHALWTDRKAIPQGARDRYRLLLGGRLD
jgi:5'-methylthioadenosine phosphorylase